MAEGKRGTKREASRTRGDSVTRVGATRQSSTRGRKPSTQGASRTGRPTQAARASSAGTRRQTRTRERLETPATRRKQAQRKAGAASILMRVLAVLGILLVLGAVGYLVARNTSLFSIDQIEAAPTEHLSAEDISKLASVEQGANLLNVDSQGIAASLCKNPWVSSVDIERSFPHTLKITIHERQVGALVLMSRGSLAWYIGTDDVWIEPVTVTGTEQKSARDSALELARQKNAVLVTDVPATVEPISGETATDAEIQALSAYAQGFSEQFLAGISGFSAASVESISCTLSSGVEVSLGQPEQIQVKEAIVTELIKRFPSGLTYINVRTPANPSYRRIGTDYVQTPQQTGASGGEAGGQSGQPRG